MKQELAQFTAIYIQIVAYLVEYSFQIVGAVIVFLIGLFISRRVSLCFSRPFDVFFLINKSSRFMDSSHL